MLTHLVQFVLFVVVSWIVIYALQVWMEDHRAEKRFRNAEVHARATINRRIDTGYYEDSTAHDIANDYTALYNRSLKK